MFSANSQSLQGQQKLLAFKIAWYHVDQEIKDDANPAARGWFTGSLTSSGSSLALAFLCTKALLPIRVPLTLAITPPIAR